MRRFFVVMLMALALFAISSVVSSAYAQETPLPEDTLTPTPLAGTVGAGPTPTIDRLAAPPTVSSPTQADEGAQLYWLHCQPCHGDQGQGLTDEWRMQYPEEDRNCWNSGCHGNNPYEGGFTVPTVVPAVIGENTLRRFATMGDVYEYMRVAMPLSFPGTLTEEEYLALTAYLARAHGVWDGRPLDPAHAFRLRLPQSALQPTGVATIRNDLTQQMNTLSPTPVIGTTAMAQPASTFSLSGLNWFVVLIFALLCVGGIVIWSRNR
jgi:mono/diheme cytochrome c family protein